MSLYHWICWLFSAELSCLLLLKLRLPCSVSFDCRRSALLLSASHLLGMFRATLALYSFAFAFAFASACLLAYLLLITFVARWRETSFICLEIEPFFFRCLCLASPRLVLSSSASSSSSSGCPHGLRFTYASFVCLFSFASFAFCLLLFCELNIILIRMVHFPSTALQTPPKIDRFSFGFSSVLGFRRNWRSIPLRF